MKTQFRYYIAIVFITALISACKKNDSNIVSPAPPPPPSTDTTGLLKSATTIPISFAISYNAFLNNSAYRSVVVREVSSVTFENEMKHNAIVQNNGNKLLATLRTG